MITLTATVTIKQEDGWHARPATEFARIVGEAGLETTIGRAGSEPTRGDSVLSLLTMGARFGETLEIKISYAEEDLPQAQQLLTQLTQLF
jgi:phosphocarrier protein HPr